MAGRVTQLRETWESPDPASVIPVLCVVPCNKGNLGLNNRANLLVSADCGSRESVCLVCLA